MNIVYFHRTQARGVEGVHIGEIVKAFRHLGHQVTLVSPVGERLGNEAAKPGAANAPSLKERLYGFVSRNLPEFIFELIELGYNLQALRQTHRQVDMTQVDMLFERYAIFSVIGAYLSKKWGKPLIVEVNYTSCSPLVRRRSVFLMPLARYVDRYIFNQATGLAAVSSHIKQHLIDTYGIPAEKIVVLPNAADPEVFDMNRITRVTIPGATGKIIGFVGGFYPWHGLEMLLEVFRTVAEKVEAAQLLLVGDGPMMTTIRQKVHEYRLDDRVILTGKVAHPDLPGYIANFDIGIMPDSNDYGSPMKIFEYMSMGKPVVVPDYPPLLDVVQDGQEGRVFRARNVREMADCLIMLLTDTAAYTRMALQARRKVVNQHNWLVNVTAILDLAGMRRT